jgi:acetolactate synthase, large subunit (EC 2.2.1.6)
MIMPRAVDLLAREMERMGVDKVFGIIGGQIMPFFDALYNTNIRSICLGTSRVQYTQPMLTAGLQEDP